MDCHTQLLFREDNIYVLLNESDEMWGPSPQRCGERLWESQICCENVRRLSRPKLAQALRAARARR
jgi:hypothetical protein